MENSALRLPAILDLGAATPLWTQLCAAQGQALRVDASEVERIGGLCLQLLIAAEAKWSADGVPFAVENPSSVYSEGVRLMVGADTLASAEQFV